MEEFIDLLRRFWVEVLHQDIRMVFTILCGLATFVISEYCVIKFLKKYEKKPWKKAERAIEAGNTCKATRIRHYYDKEVDNNGKSSKWHATYEFEVAGKKYKHHFLSHAFPPTELDVYWNLTPRFSFSQYDRKPHYLSVCILPFVLTGVVEFAISHILGITEFFK